MSKTSLSPQTDRILSLDILRGIAVLGILIMNIQSFSMISAAYINPAAYGNLEGANKWVWIISHVMADQKFMSIFSMLFGAGILLFCHSVEKKGFRPARFYYRRLFWLFTIGLIHGYLFWHGDILVAYAVCGALVFLFRKLSPWVLIALAAIILMVPSFNYWLFSSSMEMWPPDAVEGLNSSWKPSPAEIQSEETALRGSLSDQFAWRVPETFKMETFIFFIWMGWRALAMMMVGMALYKLGIFSVNFSRKSLLWIMAVAFPVGYTLITYGVNRNFEADWAVTYSMFRGWQYNYIGSIFVAMGYLALIMLMARLWRMRLMANVGKLAFTNYLLMTVICTLLFYGHGFGQFGMIDRVGQATIVVVIWVIILLFSWLWLRYFYYGPVEWLWRYLTYGNRPKFKREK